MKALAASRPKKRVFLGMLLLAAASMAVLLSLIWWIGRPGLAQIAAWLPGAVGLLFFCLIALVGLGLVNIALAVNGLPYLRWLQKQSYGLINALFPLAVLLGKPLGLRRRQLERSFIAVSNALFRRRQVRVRPDELLVVTPHCLQLATCPRKITRDPHNCKQCGGCDIGALVAMSDEMGFHFFVATGGTLARQIIYQTRPKAVLAIACERDLMSGIQDVYPLPAVGVLNLRPNGPCFNTHVNIEAVRRELEKILIPVSPEERRKPAREALFTPFRQKEDDDG